MLTLAGSASAESAIKREVTEFKLDNGMHVVVVPDRRAPVVTHMVWYRVGAADEPIGVSGIAHFLEHLMFKSTENLASGEFSKIVSRLGGQDNAFTSQDATAYFQRITREHLGTVMRMEADRMVNLKLNEEDVRTERDVILEERRSRVENSPSSLLSEQMNAALYLGHPYGIPVIGWMHEMKTLSRKDALDFYKRFYAPNNAILIVAGDVTADDVRRLATETYGKIPADPAISPKRVRVKEPVSRAARRVVLRDARAGQPVFRRFYSVPSYSTAKAGDAEALDLLLKILASGTTSRLYQTLVSADKVGSSAGGYYSGSALDTGKAVFYGVPANGVTLEDFEAAFDKVIADVIKNGVTQAELDRARKAYIADFVYEIDSQSTLARRYGWGLVVGHTIAEIDGWPEALKKVTVDDIKRVAASYLNINASVTGYLIPEAVPSQPQSSSAKPATRS
ncbi:MAG: pitrilysin family protein [Pseudomonadota bacterium]